jgi:hypothetical protein
MKMDSALRPRDIQARIRAGESPEDVASAARTSVEAIMGFATPVLAERAHVAQTAQKASVRRRTGESGGTARTLGESAELFFAGHALHDEDISWDAWRQPDGRWALVADYAVEGLPRRAEFTHDLPGRYVVAENDEARLLTGELREPGTRAPSATQARRLTSVPHQDELPLGDDALELVRDPTAETADPDWIAADGAAAVDVPLPGTQQPDALPSEELTAEVPLEEPEAGGEEAAAEEAPTRSTRGRRKGRSSIPSWDEIMFGDQRE